VFGWLSRFFRWMFRMKPKTEYEFTKGRRDALDKARTMKEIRKQAKATPGGKGPIRNRPAAVKLYGGKKKA
jgi:hypothetical protein